MKLCSSQRGEEDCALLSEYIAFLSHGSGMPCSMPVHVIWYGWAVGYGRIFDFEAVYRVSNYRVFYANDPSWAYIAVSFRAEESSFLSSTSPGKVSDELCYLWVVGCNVRHSYISNLFLNH